MEDKKILLDNINKIHTTELGVDRIKRNLKIDIVDVVEYCKNKVLDENCHIYKQGKNWYCEIENVKITAFYGAQRSPFCFRTAAFRSQRPPIF